MGQEGGIVTIEDLHRSIAHKVYRLRLRGRSFKELSEKVGVTPPTLRNMCRKHVEDLPRGFFTDKQLKLAKQ